MNSIHFMWAAYIATWAILGGYLVSIVRRYRRLQREQKDLQGKGFE
jgi:CcmD family protein